MVAVLALCVVGASARMVMLTAKAAFHTDEWCADHHLGEGPSSCIMHDGCCYDGRAGKCHSCTHHSDYWCDENGGSDAKVCSGYAGCTMSYPNGPDDLGECVSNSDPSEIKDDLTCEEALIQATEDTTGETEMPECDPNDGTWESMQTDGDSGKLYCVDENGHTIPDTMMIEKAFKERHINCNKERKKHAGMQCPNAVTLATGDGEVMINDLEDVGNCDVTCNSDKDCRDDDWCCYNGCGYSCQTPITPKASCEVLALDESLQADNLEFTHGVKVTVECAEGYGGSDAVEIECKHGAWTPFKMECLKDCEAFRIKGARVRDYEIKGNGMSHGSKRRVSCTKGYGAVAGTPDAMRFYKETLECINGAWEERSLQCSSCFDAPAEGPHAFWTGREQEYQLVDHDEDPMTPMVKKLVDVGTERGGPYAFDCLHFQSRPQMCAEFPSAQKNCRIACRTCEQMLMLYKVKAVQNNKDDVNHPDKWIKKKLKILESFREEVTDMKQFKVAKRVKKFEDHY
jgi:hypothetical protein